MASTVIQLKKKHNAATHYPQLLPDDFFKELDRILSAVEIETEILLGIDNQFENLGSCTRNLMVAKAKIEITNEVRNML